LFTIHDPITKHTQALASKLSKLKIASHFACISKDQARDLRVKHKHIVYNGITIKDYPFNAKPKDYLAFSGRMVKQKGAAIAIKAAASVNKPIKLAGTIPKKPKERSYFIKQVKPLLTHKAQHLGIIPYHKMNNFYRNARALLFPIQWEEPFGLVMIEAMAAGTPVIAFKRGSVPEVIKHGKTGFIVKNEEQMIKAIKKIYEMPDKKYTAMRHACRKYVEDNFSTKRMADNYEKLYYSIVAKNKE